MTELFAFPPTQAAQTSPSDSLPPDWEARQRALDIQQSCIVEAPAGSGKTGLLIQRYLKLLGDSSVDLPDQVLAITFTVKATTEIRDRIMSQLQAAAGPDLSRSRFDRETRAFAQNVLQRDAQLNWRLLENPRRLRIRTIHSLCAEIASSLPVLSGSGGAQSPVEDPWPLYREAARQTLMLLGGADAALNEALRTVLLHRDGNLGDCERLLMEMLALRDQWGALIPLQEVALTDAYLEDTVLPQLQRALEQAVCRGLAELAQTIPSDFLKALCSLARSLAENEPYKRDHSPIEICCNKTNVPSTEATDLPHWRALLHLLVAPSSGTWRKNFARNHIGFETTPHQKKLLKALLAEVTDREDVLYVIKKANSLPPAVYPLEQWNVIKALFRVLRRALAELQVVFAERGECDFAELGLLARTALQHEGAADNLAAAFGMKLQHLLVDEMQDTSTSQYELIELLTQGWDGHSQTIFLVGDPKQSIYLFRKAHVERFILTMVTGRLGDVPVEPLQLTANFRSQSNLVEQFNETFSQIFPAGRSAINPEDVPYVEAAPVRGPNSKAAAIVWHGAAIPKGLTAEQKASSRRAHSVKEAETVRSIIQQWRARPLPKGRTTPWKIAILVRGRNHLADIVQALSRDDGDGAIPIRAVDIEALGRRQEILDLHALTRALLHPADRVAWLSVLHAPWCGLGLADLHRLMGADDPVWEHRSVQDVVAERGHLLSEDNCARLARIWPVFLAAAEQRSRLTAAQLVERTWRSLGGDTYLQPFELANAKRYLQLLDEIEQQTGTVDSSQLSRQLDKLFAQTTASEDAVELMTIHKSKGLEWDFVVVPALQKHVLQDRGQLLTWAEIDSEDEEAARIILAPIKSKGEASKELNAWLNTMQKAREAAESKRLFYVASTRAREELHLFATAETNASGVIYPVAGSLLKTAWPVAQKHFALAPAPASRDAASLPFPTTGEEFALDLAAVGEVATGPRLRRLPLEFNPRKRFEAFKPLLHERPGTEVNSPTFERPDGSLEARGFGNTVHAFLELLTTRLKSGISAETLQNEITGWLPRIMAVLRSNGIAPSALDKRAQQVRTALLNSLNDPDGLWILSAHAQASTEHALTSWSERRTSVRLDRVFRAGAKPQSTGHDYLWIIDYKTTIHGPEGIHKFLEDERARYSPQMETYARILKADTPSALIHLGLYYPMLPKLVWWQPALA